MITDISQTADFRSFISSHKLVLADFYTTWCEPCKILDEVLGRISGSLPHSGEIIRIDSEELPDLASSFSIKSAPVLILFRNGEEIWRMNGFQMDKELLQQIDEVSRET